LKPFVQNFWIIASLTAASTLVASSAFVSAQNLSKSCGEWKPSSLQHSGPVSVIVNDKELIWSNGRGIHTATFIDGDIVRKTYSDGVSLYVAYGFPEGTDGGFSPSRIIRIFYQSPGIRQIELKCE